MVIQLANSLKYRPPATDIKLAHAPTHSAAGLQLHNAYQRATRAQAHPHCRLYEVHINHVQGTAYATSE